MISRLCCWCPRSSSGTVRWPNQIDHKITKGKILSLSISCHLFVASVCLEKGSSREGLFFCSKRRILLKRPRLVSNSDSLGFRMAFSAVCDSNCSVRISVQWIVSTHKDLRLGVEWGTDQLKQKERPLTRDFSFRTAGQHHIRRLRMIIWH